MIQERSHTTDVPLDSPARIKPSRVVRLLWRSLIHTDTPSWDCDSFNMRRNGPYLLWWCLRTHSLPLSFCYEDRAVDGDAITRSIISYPIEPVPGQCGVLFTQEHKYLLSSASRSSANVLEMSFAHVIQSWESHLNTWRFFEASCELGMQSGKPCAHLDYIQNGVSCGLNMWFVPPHLKHRYSIAFLLS